MKQFILVLLIIWTGQATAYDENQLIRFSAMKKCPSCDLSGADLKRVQTGTGIIKHVDLRKANLHGADLSGLTFLWGDLSGADLTDANLQFTQFGSTGARTNLTDANLIGATIDGANFQDAIFCNTKTPWGIENIDC